MSAGDVGARPDAGTLLPAASEQDWAVLFSYSRPRTAEAGEVLVDVGDADACLYVVLEGTLDVLVPSRRLGRLRTVGQLGPGAVFGEISFFDGLARSARVTAATPVVVALLDREGFAGLTRADPHLANALLLDLGRVLSGRVRAAEQRT